MPPLTRTCSECDTPLTGKSAKAKTCSNACRLTRSRRQKRANREIEEFAAANNTGAQEIAAIVRREAPDVVTRVMKDQLAPIVREALTEDVLRAINEMVGLTPRAVAALHEDLESDDSVIRQRAYTLLIKYTVGHPALVKSEDATAGQQLVVNFNLPRPDAEDLDEGSLPEADVVRICDICHIEKPADMFVADSERCQSCLDEWREKVLAEFS